MNSHAVPDTLTKISRMGDATLYEPAGDQPLREKTRFQSHSLSECITQVSMSGGKKPILKTMLTTACERNCYYCPFRAGRSKTERYTLTPDEMARGFDALYQAKQVDGLFLSSGIIKGSVNTQDRLIDTVEIIRKRGYRGYIHLKVMPGIEYDQLYRAMQLATRVSVNLEGATQERLNALAPKKDFNRELLQVLLWGERLRRQHPHEKLANTVTQFVVGAVGDTDLELMSISEKLYGQAGLARAYYSAFHPVEGTPFENLPSPDARREFRLYQASFLLRDYGWSSEDLTFGADGNLRTDVDPKRVWADEHLRAAPVDVMTAGREQLLRVPGIGPVLADAILKARRTTTLTDLAQLRKLGVRAPAQAAPYILLNGRRPESQLSLWG
ncbi:MAG TPA: radical SAM protein [Aggregatilineales bacterium]|nr:radical SAM protein [Aggregatilineales bacterium]